LNPNALSLLAAGMWIFILHNDPLFYYDSGKLLYSSFALKFISNLQSPELSLALSKTTHP